MFTFSTFFNTCNNPCFFCYIMHNNIYIFLFDYPPGNHTSICWATLNCFDLEQNKKPTYSGKDILVSVWKCYLLLAILLCKKAQPNIKMGCLKICLLHSFFFSYTFLVVYYKTKTCFLVKVLRMFSFHVTMLGACVPWTKYMWTDIGNKSNKQMNPTFFSFS